MKDVILAIMAAISMTVWTALSFGLVSYAIHAGWNMAGW